MGEFPPFGRPGNRRAIRVRPGVPQVPGRSAARPPSPRPGRGAAGTVPAAARVGTGPRRRGRTARCVDIVDKVH